MDPLTWTGSLAFITPIFMIALLLLAATIAIWVVVSIFSAGTRHVANADGTMSLAGNPQALAALGRAPVPSGGGRSHRADPIIVFGILIIGTAGRHHWRDVAD